MWADMGHMGWSWGIFGALHMILWWVLVVLGIVVLAKWLLAGGRSSGPRALEILKERYARGDIDKETFEQMKRDLAA